jgi:hypothetical protein
MNSKTVLRTLSTLALAVAPLFANTPDEDIEYIQTSRPHNLPRLLTLQTAEVLESYGIAFAGGGNIHSALKGDNQFFRGSLYLGLGDVAELGYEQEAIQLGGESDLKRMRGHIKIQPIQEKNFIPAIAISYGSSLNPSEGLIQESRELERSQWGLSLSKSFDIGSTSFTVHPSVAIQQDKLSQVEDTENKPLQKRRIDGQLGLTWQSNSETMFLIEARSLSIVDRKDLATGSIDYQNALQGNLGVRFYLRNWIFMDAGLLNMYNIDRDEWNNGIHANLTGVIPLRSVSERVAGWFHQ